MSEMTYRTVDVTARVYSGSDDHAKHTVYWALEPENVVFRDDDVYTLEHILSAIACGEPIDDACREEAAGLLEHVMWAGNDVMIKKLEVRGGIA